MAGCLFFTAFCVWILLFTLHCRCTITQHVGILVAFTRSFRLFLLLYNLDEPDPCFSFDIFMSTLDTRAGFDTLWLNHCTVVGSPEDGTRRRLCQEANAITKDIRLDDEAYCRIVKKSQSLLSHSHL
jgi:hypothetical protein